MTIRNNFERGDRALKALAGGEYQHPEETVGIKIPVPSGELVDGPEGYPISDLIADLCHLARRYDFDPLHLITQGIKHFGADCVEQAFISDDDWGDTLDERCIEKATMVLRANGLPEEYDREIFVFTGILPPGSND